MKSTTSVAVGSEVPFLDLSAQYQRIKPEIDAAMQQVLNEAAFIGGRFVREFEEQFASYLGVSEVIGVANGTDALEVILEAQGWDASAEVIVPANSFVATSEAVTRAGYRVVFADVKPETFTLDPEDVRSRITGDTRAIVAVHLYGRPADLRSLASICDEHQLLLFEDAAQAHGAQLDGTVVGAHGAASSFSFYPGKNLGAYGDAGAIATNDAKLAESMRMLANHGRITKYDHAFEGRNSRLDAIQAAVLSVKLRHLDDWIEHRRAIAERYLTALEGIDGLHLPATSPGLGHVYHLFVVRTDRRDELRDWLSQRGVRSGIHYPIALPRLDAYGQHPQADEPFVAANLAGEVLSLPIGDALAMSDVDRVCSAVRAFFR